MNWQVWAAAGFLLLALGRYTSEGGDRAPTPEEPVIVFEVTGLG